MDCGQNEWHFFEGELDRPDVRALLDRHFAEMRADSPPEACHVLPLNGLRAANIRFLSLRDPDGRLLGIGALKTLEPGHCEIKSMRTDPGSLGRGVGRALLGHLIALAKAAGMAKISLETGNSPLFEAANHLYESAGFIRCGPFGGYSPTDFTHFYTRAL